MGTLQKEFGFTSVDTIFRESRAQIVHGQHRLALVLEGGRVIRICRYKEISFNYKPTLAEEVVPAPLLSTLGRPGATALVRRRACWNASAAMSETNF
jgi:hypothetical protein